MSSRSLSWHLWALCKAIFPSCPQLAITLPTFQYAYPCDYKLRSSRCLDEGYTLQWEPPPMIMNYGLLLFLRLITTASSAFCFAYIWILYFNALLPNPALNQITFLLYSKYLIIFFISHNKSYLFLRLYNFVNIL